LIRNGSKLGLKKLQYREYIYGDIEIVKKNKNCTSSQLESETKVGVGDGIKR